MTDHIIRTVEELKAVYDQEPSEASIIKESKVITNEYRRLIEASPFLALASVNGDEVDCSPRGDLKGFVRIHDEKTLMIPDRRGNNRVDTLLNVVQDPRVSLMFMIPGAGNILRVNGRAHLSIDPDLLQSFEEQGKPPRSVMVIEIDIMYFQCARAIMRAKLWDPAEHVQKGDIPTPGQIMKEIKDGDFDAETYDGEWAGRAAKTMW